jgi:hypothetical protein
MHFAVRAPKCACNCMLQFYVAGNAYGLEMHASTEEFTWFLYVRTPLVTASHNLFPRGQEDALTSLLIHAN